MQLSIYFQMSVHAVTLVLILRCPDCDTCGVRDPYRVAPPPAGQDSTPPTSPFERCIIFGVFNTRLHFIFSTLRFHTTHHTPSCSVSDPRNDTLTAPPRFPFVLGNGTDTKAVEHAIIGISVDNEQEHLGHESAEGRVVRAEGGRAQEVERLRQLDGECEALGLITASHE